MPHHFALHPSALLIGVVAFATAAVIFGFFAWRALRMSRQQIERFARLPFAADDSASSPASPSAHRPHPFRS